jgi:hypothetical protein
MVTAQQSVVPQYAGPGLFPSFFLLTLERGSMTRAEIERALGGLTRPAGVEIEVSTGPFGAAGEGAPTWICLRLVELTATVVATCDGTVEVGLFAADGTELFSEISYAQHAGGIVTIVRALLKRAERQCPGVG